MVTFGVQCTGSRLSVLILAVCYILISSPTHAYIYAYNSNMSTVMFDDLPASFGSALPNDGLMGVLVSSRPLNGCTAIDPPPALPPSVDPNSTRFIVLIQRNDCFFDIKVLHAQQAGYSAAIVHNMYSDILLRMSYNNETLSKEIQIPSVFTSYHASKSLRKFIIGEEGTYVILVPESEISLSLYLIPFIGVVGLIIVVMFIIVIVRCVQYRKRLRKNRLTKGQLKRIPIHKFNKGDDYDVCAICLDEYEEGDKLRVLPCSHAYHCKCVDPWLTKTKKTCPVCKQRVIRPNPEQPESESEDETGGRGEGSEGEADTERTPLLRPSNPGTPSGSPVAYSATALTIAQCLTSPSRCESPLLGYEGYYSPQEDTDSESEDTGDDRHHTDDDTGELMGRNGVQI